MATDQAHRADYQTTSEFWDNEDEALNADAFAVHPGLILKNTILPALRISGAALADHLHVPRPGFNNMLNGKRALTSQLARKIELAINYPASILVRLQAEHELAEARRSVSAENIQPLVEMA
jgi:antitoxin HigA-1